MVMVLVSHFYVFSLLLGHFRTGPREKKMFYSKTLWHLAKPEFDFTIFFSIILCNMYVLEPNCAVSVAFSKSDFLKMSWGKMGWAVFINLAARHEARFYDFPSERNDDKNSLYYKMRELFSLFIQKRVHIRFEKNLSEVVILYSIHLYLSTTLMLGERFMK